MMNDGVVIRDGYESHVRREQGLSSSKSTEESASARSRPGILIFSRARQLLHMNRRALELTGHSDQTELGPVHDFRSAQVRELSAQIQETLDRRREADIWEIFELKRVIFETERKILVRGFGLADRNSHDASRIVVVLEEVGPRQKHQTQQAPVFSIKNLYAVP
jgi:PAS domain-containing protein